uniref:L-ascorbate oxidase homolog n=1 Tax=Cucumis melo TaxID=3656 RepID=A0A9I9D9I4_CUCME
MAGLMFTTLLCLSAAAMTTMVRGEDPYFFFTWNVTYGTISPLGVPQQGILINGQFPGPNINSTTNNNLVINVFNNLDEPFLLHWYIYGTATYILIIFTNERNSAQEELLARWATWNQLPNPTGNELHLPFPNDYTVLIGDWYTKSHTTLKQFLDSGRSIARPDGVLINGKTAKGDGTDEPLFTMKPGKTYKYRVCNVGLKTSLNFRFQGHTMKLVEMEGSHTVQNDYKSLDVHVGQCFSVLVTADQEPKDYYMVASTRFIKSALVGKGIVRYTNGKGPASPELPNAPMGWAWSLNQFRTFRWNLTASAARPNPQGSYHYGSINITRTIKLVNSASKVDGKLRYAINGVSHVDPETPLKLAEYFGVTDKVFKYDTISDEGLAEGATTVTVAPNVVNTTFRNFIEIIFENHEKSLQSWHLDGYSFFAVAIEPGRWTPEKRSDYNLLDAVSRHTIQVFPKSWAAILLTFDNAGMWNLRSELAENRYLGQQLYMSVQSPARSLRDEYNIPDNTLLCGLVKDLPLPKPYTI